MESHILYKSWVLLIPMTANYGTGAGIPSLPKIRIVDRSERSDADVNYTFIGIGIQRDEVD
jgi:2-methylaconitate cis-trans-isomerase PrpF